MKEREEEKQGGSWGPAGCMNKDKDCWDGRAVQRAVALETRACGSPLLPGKATCFVCSLVGVRKSPQTLPAPLPDSGECLSSISLHLYVVQVERAPGGLLSAVAPNTGISPLLQICHFAPFMGRTEPSGKEKAARAQRGCASVQLEMSFSRPRSHFQLLWTTLGQWLALRRICSNVSVVNEKCIRTSNSDVAILSPQGDGSRRQYFWEIIRPQG